MPHVIETASSGRAKCRACNGTIAKDELRFGERHPNAFGEGEMTLWFHLQCASYTRPEPFLETLPSASVSHAADLTAAAEFGIAHRRVPRVHGAERASTGRARCRSCREFIAQGEWRIPLIFFEEFRFAPSGFIHAGCAREYFETTDLLDRIRHFSPALAEDEVHELQGALHAPAAHSRKETT